MNKDTVFYKNFKPEEEKISNLDIQKYEKKYNFQLPEDYIEFLLELNGGIITYQFLSNDFTIASQYNIVNKYLDICDISDFYSLETAEFRIENEDPTVDHYNTNVLPNNLAPIAMDGSGYFEFYIGASEENSGKIYYYELEIDKGMFLISNSFTEFIEGFYLEEIKEDDEE